MATPKKVIYIAGPITGRDKYYEPFERAMDEIQAAGMIPLNPCWQPQGLTRETNMKLALTMLSCADGALFLPGWSYSPGANLEMQFCEDVRKPAVTVKGLESPGSLRTAVRSLQLMMEGADR